MRDDWQESALCRQADPELWFADRETPVSPDGAGRALNQAKQICRTCPVQLPCLETALANNERYGVWAGINFGTTKRREEMRRHLGITVNPRFEHGTVAGAKAHQRRGETACPSCRNAERAYRRRA